MTTPGMTIPGMTTPGMAILRMTIPGMMVMTAGSFRGWDDDFEIHRPDAVTLNPLGGELEGLRYPQPPQRRSDGVQIDPEIDQGAQEHVPGDAAKGVDMQVVGHAGR